MTLQTRDTHLEPLRVDGLIGELRHMIDQTKESVASTVNASLTLLYWQLGFRIRTELLQNERAEYGQKIVATVSRQLMADYGKGFVEKSLRRMIQFAEVFPEKEIVVSLIRQLSWTHFIALIPIKDPLKRDFYAEMCRLERWSVKTLRKKIDSMLFERTALSKKPDSLIRYEVDSLRNEDRLSPDLVFRDPYFLDFLNLNDRYFEKDLEDAIMRELEQFLLENRIAFQRSIEGSIAQSCCTCAQALRSPVRAAGGSKCMIRSLKYINYLMILKETYQR